MENKQQNKTRQFDKKAKIFSFIALLLYAAQAFGRPHIGDSASFFGYIASFFILLSLIRYFKSTKSS